MELFDITSYKSQIKQGEPVNSWHIKQFIEIFNSEVFSHLKISGSLDILGDLKNTKISDVTSDYIVVWDSDSGKFGKVHRNNISTKTEYSTTLNPNETMVTPVGGIVAGTSVSSLKGQTFTNLFDSLLFPILQPTTSNPTVSLSRSGEYLHEIGSTVNTVLTPSFTKGLISNSWGGNQGQYAGNPTAVVIEYNNTNSLPNFTGTTIAQTTITHQVQQGDNDYTLRVTFPQGPTFLDNRGDPSTLPRYSGATLSASVNIHGTYPIFVGTSGGNLVKRDLTNINANNITISQNYGETHNVRRHKIEIPIALINSRTTTIQIWNNVANAYNDLSPSTFDVTDSTKLIQGNIVSYKLYIKNGSTGGGDVNGNPLYRIKFT
jgi:hypothetical protein